jgi:hypothetical protein
MVLLLGGWTGGYLPSTIKVSVCYETQHTAFYQGEFFKECATHGKGEKVYKVLVEKPEGKRLLGRPGLRRKNVIRIDLREISWGRVVDWIRLAQNRDRWLAVVNVVMNLRVLATRS